MKDRKKQAILVYIAAQILFLWIFINFPLQPFPGKVMVQEASGISEYDADISFGQYLFPEQIDSDEHIVSISFKPLGWILLVLIVFVTPFLLAFRWAVTKKEKSDDGTEE